MNKEATPESVGAAAAIDRRGASLLLSGLVLTPDSSLEVFRERRAADAQLSLERLRRAREILEQVSLAITSVDRGRWERIEKAWSVLCEEQAATSPSEARDASVPAEPAPRAAPSEPRVEPAPRAAPSEPRATPSSPPPALGHPAFVGRPPTAPAAVGAAPAAGPVVGMTPARPPLVGIAGAAGPSGPLATESPWAIAARPTPVEPASAPPLPSSPPPAGPALGVDHALGSDRPSAGVTVTAGRARTSDFPAALAGTVAPSTGLPFRRGEATPPPPTAPAKPQSAGSLGETAEVGMLSPLAKMSLPFRMAATPPTKAGAVAAAGHEPTAALPASGPPVAAPAASAEPVDELAPHLGALTLEQYAAIRAQCDAMPQWAAQILGRYHVRSDSEWRVLDRHWQRRVASDPALAESFRRQYAQVEQWLSQQRQK